MGFFKFLAKVILGIIVVFSTVVLCFVSMIVVLAAFVIMIGSSGQSDEQYRYLSGNKDSGNKILLVKLNGVIMGDEEGDSSLLGSFTEQNAFGYKIKDQLRKAADDRSIKAVVLQINSPGGTIYGARAVADGVKYFRDKTHKPVISYVAGLAASGGFWAAVSADKIIADYGSTIGSIGVITGPFKYYDKVLSEDGGAFQGGVVTQNGIQSYYITAGKGKDAGNPYRKLSDDEIKILQQGVNNEYDNFVGYVSQRRQIDQNTIRNQIGAMVYDNQSAQDLNLIDKTENKEDAYADLAKMAKLKQEDYQIVEENTKSKGLVGDLLQAYHNVKTPQVQSPGCHIQSAILVYSGNLADLCSN